MKLTKTRTSSATPMYTNRGISTNRKSKLLSEMIHVTYDSHHDVLGRYIVKLAIHCRITYFLFPIIVKKSDLFESQFHIPLDASVQQTLDFGAPFNPKIYILRILRRVNPKTC